MSATLHEHSLKESPANVPLACGGRSSQAKENNSRMAFYASVIQTMVLICGTSVDLYSHNLLFGSCRNELFPLVAVNVIIFSVKSGHTLLSFIPCLKFARPFNKQLNVGTTTLIFIVVNCSVVLISLMEVLAVVTQCALMRSLFSSQCASEGSQCKIVLMYTFMQGIALLSTFGWLLSSYHIQINVHLVNYLKLSGSCHKRCTRKCRHEVCGSLIDPIPTPASTMGF